MMVLAEPDSPSVQVKVRQILIGHCVDDTYGSAGH